MKCAALLVLPLWLAHLLCAADEPSRRARSNASHGGDTLSPLVQLISTTDDPKFQLDILKGVSDGLKGRRAVSMPEGWEPLAGRLSQSSNAQVRELAQSLSVLFGSKTAFAALRSTLINPAASLPARTNALATLVQVKDPDLVPALEQVLREPALRSAALRGLATYDDPGAPSAIVDLYPALSTAEKNIALATLASRTSYARALLLAASQSRIPVKDLTADVVRQLRTLKNPDIDAQLAKIWGVAHETEADKLKDIARFKQLIATKGFGDPRRGRAVFSRVCQQCHTLFGEGGKVGPELTGANRGDLDYLLQNIIDPNALIPNDYRTWNVETRDDRSITGIVTKQDDKTVTIMTATETLVIPRGEVQTLNQTELSLMPEGLLQPLTETETRDLLAYLRGQTQVPLPSP